jgi:hypothetical protein
LVNFGQEQMGGGGKRLAPLQAEIMAPFKMIEAQFRFLVLKAALHAPPRETDEQELLDRRTRFRVAHKVLQLGLIQHIRRDHQVVGTGGVLLLILPGHQDVLDPPEHRPPRSILHAVCDPLLIPHGRAKPQQMTDFDRRAALARTPWGRHPHSEIYRNFAHISLFPLF